MLRELKKIPISTVIKLSACTMSALLLAAAFPPISDKTAAWVALIPLFLIARTAPPGESFKWGFISGLIFWLCSISWLLRLIPNGGSVPVYISGPMVSLGWILLSSYCAVYTGIFMALISMVGSARSRWPVLGELVVLAAAPVFWAGCEYWRSTLFTGFPWNCLGISQYLNLPVIQIAECGGVYAVSAVVVLMNAALAGTVSRFIDAYLLRMPHGKTFRFGLMIGLAVVSFVFFDGVKKVRLHDAIRKQGRLVKVSAIQPNIPQAAKWSDAHELMIYERLAECTDLAAVSRPDIIVWPETALPYCLASHEYSYLFCYDLAKKGVPLLIGSMELTGQPGQPDSKCYNSSYLMGSDGTIAGRYRKIHLVPFGEYFPFDKTVTCFQQFVPIGITCYPGSSYEVFEINLSGSDKAAGKVRFAALICFEDIMAYIARGAVRHGAGFLVNQTNDAWFEGSSASVQHLSHCVFRCVENRVPAVRSGNTGVTCFIDSSGRIDSTTLSLLRGGNRSETKSRTAPISVQTDNSRKTLYTRYGDLLFGIPSGILAACAAIYLAGIRLIPRFKRSCKNDLQA